MQRQKPRGQRVADHLVHRVVAAHVLAHEQQLAVGREQPGRVHAAGELEAGLAQPVRQVGQQLARHHGPGRQRRRVDRHLLDAPLPHTPHDEVV